MRKNSNHQMTAKSGSWSGTASMPRSQPARVGVSASSVVLLSIDSDEPSDAMMDFIASKVDQSFVADDSI